MMLYRRRRRGRAGDILVLGALAAVLAATAMLVSAIAALIIVVAIVALIAIVAVGLILAVPALKGVLAIFERWLAPRGAFAASRPARATGWNPEDPGATRVLMTRRSTLKKR